MIEFINSDACTGCHKCVEVCPQDVFELATQGAAPELARQGDCTSCRQCVLHCPESAVFVTLLGHRLPELNKQEIIASGRLKSYAAWLGWKNGIGPNGDRSGNEEYYVNALREKRGERNAPDPADRVRRQLYEARERNYI
jgi:NAD-dependent dihydropyrimidine dehydrogenase PreA subunit